MIEQVKLIGLAGETSSGKTTVLEHVGKRLHDKLTVLSFDEYDLYPPGSHYPSSIEHWEDPTLFDCERYLQDLHRLKNGLPITLQARSRESIANTGGINTQILYPTQITMVEGIFAYHNTQTRELFDFLIYIHIPPDEMVRRRLARSLGSPYPWDDPAYIRGNMVEATEKNVLPQMAHAHLVLHGLLPTIELADQLVDAIKHLSLSSN